MSIEAVAFAVPSLRQTAKEVANQTGASAEFIAGKVGMAERYILADGETGVSLSVAACKALADRSRAPMGRIGLLVCVTQNPDRRLPHNAPQIAHDLGLPYGVATFDISLGCSGFVYGVEIVEGFLARSGIEHAILVTCDPYSRIMASEDRHANCVFGDAATATWIHASGTRSRTLATDFGTDGAAGSAISVPHGGAAHPLVSLNGGPTTSTHTRDDLRLHMDGRSVYNFVLDRVPASIHACLRRAGCTIDAIDHFVLHQGSAFMLEALGRKAGLPPERMARNMARFGNTVSSSIPMLLAELDNASALRGRTVLMSGFGVGLSWATSVVRFD